MDASFDIKGMKELQAVMMELKAELGGDAKAARKATSQLKIVKAVRVATKPLKEQVRRNLKSVIKGAEKRTPGTLKSSVRSVTRAANKKDRWNKNYGPGVVVVSKVIAGVNYFDDKGKYRPAAQVFEFGSATMAARPYLLPARTQAAPQCVSILSAEIAKILDEYSRRKG